MKSVTICSLNLNLSLLVLLAACTGGRPSEDVLVFKHGKLAGDPKVIQAVIRDFERRHPGISVREETLPSDTDQQHQFYAINLESRQVPFDVIMVDVIWVQEFAKAGWIRSLDGLLTAEERAGYFPAALRAATFDEQLYAIPWYIDAGVLYYRRDLLARYGFEPPRTWPQLVQIAKTIVEGEGDPNLKGFIWTGKQYEGLVCVALEFIWGHGGSLFDGQPETAAALAFMRDLIVRERVSPALVATADEESIRLLFADGRAVFMRNWPYAWLLFQQEGSHLRGKVGLAPLPAFPGYASASVLGGWMLAVPSRAPHPDLAMELVVALTSDRVQRSMAYELGYHPARRDLYEDPAVLEAQPVLADLYPVFEEARPRPISPYYLMLSQVMQPEFSSVIMGRKSPEAAVASIQKQMAEILALRTAVAAGHVP